MIDSFCSVDHVIKRSKCYKQIRDFFHAKRVTEVETPTLSKFTVTDPYIDTLKVKLHQEEWCLQTSPEFSMKALVAAGAGDIFQICKAYRNDEFGRLHQPEFSILEWYRCGLDYRKLMTETVSLLQLLFDGLSVKYMSYESIFSAVLNIDPFTASVNDFQSIAYAKKLLIPEDVDELTVSDWQNFLFTFCVEPYLKRYPCAVVYDYPIAISSMARVSALDQEKAERFEIYLHGFECANGYAEIEYVEDYLKRCHVHNIYRKRKGLEEVQPDANFVRMIRDGFPACSGVSVGLDRVLLLLTESEAIGEVIARNVSVNSKSLKQVAA